MKRLTFALLQIVAVSLLASTALGASAPSTSGRLIIKRSATMGRDVSVTIKIDGKLAGPVAYKRTFETQLAPGPHTITASPNRLGTPWHGTLEVRPNQTYTYTAYWTSGKLTLELTK